MFTDGVFQLRYYETIGAKTKMVYKTVGADSNKALDALHIQENRLKAGKHAEAAGVRIVEDANRKTLNAACKAFLQATEDRGSLEAKIVYETSLNAFFVAVRKTYVDELTADDMMVYMRALRDSGKADRTIYNRWSNVKAFYIHCGLDPKAMKLRAPKYEEQTPEIYEPAELKTFFASIADDAEDQAFYAACQIMLKCGLRDQEMQYLEWPQVNLARGVIHVKANPRYNFKVKDSEERNVPIPKELVAWLEKYREAYPSGRLVSPTSKGKPNGKLLLRLKNAARAAGLNCGHCDGCEKSKKCAHWFLHKFRATAITMWLRSGLDLRTVMKLSGHADLASVMRYLSPADDETVQNKVNGISWGD
jgi:integrase